MTETSSFPDAARSAGLSYIVLNRRVLSGDFPRDHPHEEPPGLAGARFRSPGDPRHSG